MRSTAPLVLTLAYLACLTALGSASPAAYTAACLGPPLGFLALAALLARFPRSGASA
jgi:hypothetical protein